MAKAVTWGVCAIAVSCVAWFVMLMHVRGAGSRTRSPVDTLAVAGPFLVWGGAALGGAIAAYFAPQSKLLVGTAMSIPATVLMALAVWLFEATGHRADSTGAMGRLAALVWNTIVCAMGAVAGSWASRN